MEKSSSIKVHRVTDPLKKKKSTFSFSQTVGEMVFVSFEVEKMSVFSSVNSSLVLGLSAVVGCSSLLSHVKSLAKGWFQLAPVSWPSCRQQASLFMARAWKSCLPFSVTNSSSSRFWATDAVFFKV